MSEAMDYDSLSYILSSEHRIYVMDALDEGPATPTEITEKTPINISDVSRSIKELREEGLVKLLVPEDRKKGRIYGLTESGKSVVPGLESDGR